MDNREWLEGIKFHIANPKIDLRFRMAEHMLGGMTQKRIYCLKIKCVAFNIVENFIQFSYFLVDFVCKEIYVYRSSLFSSEFIMCAIFM